MTLESAIVALTWALLFLNLVLLAWGSQLLLKRWASLKMARELSTYCDEILLGVEPDIWRLTRISSFVKFQRGKWPWQFRPVVYLRVEFRPYPARAEDETRDLKKTVEHSVTAYLEAQSFTNFEAQCLFS